MKGFHLIKSLKILQSHPKFIMSLLFELTLAGHASWLISNNRPGSIKHISSNRLDIHCTTIVSGCEQAYDAALYALYRMFAWLCINSKILLYM